MENVYKKYPWARIGTRIRISNPFGQDQFGNFVGFIFVNGHGHGWCKDNGCEEIAVIVHQDGDDQTFLKQFPPHRISQSTLEDFK